MHESNEASTLERSRSALRGRLAPEDLERLAVDVRVVPLSPEEAIGDPGRRDYPILVGRERVVEARLLERRSDGDGVPLARGHAFTDEPGGFEGTLDEILELPLDSNRRRAVFVATLNALSAWLGVEEMTVHCRDDDPETCGAELARLLAARPGEPVVGLVGLNPALLDHLVQGLGSERMIAADRNPDNIGQRRYGVEILDGDEALDDLLEAADVVVVTGTTLVNGTFDRIEAGARARGGEVLIYGVTAAGVAGLCGLERHCTCGRSGRAGSSPRG